MAGAQDTVATHPHMPPPGLLHSAAVHLTVSLPLLPAHGAWP